MFQKWSRANIFCEKLFYFSRCYTNLLIKKCTFEKNKIFFKKERAFVKTIKIISKLIFYKQTAQKRGLLISVFSEKNTAFTCASNTCTKKVLYWNTLITLSNFFITFSLLNFCEKIKIYKNQKNFPRFQNFRISKTLKNKYFWSIWTAW